jgi:hypothetical protein
VPDPGPIPPLDAIEPGQWITIGGKEVAVDEIDTAELLGAEGSLPFPLALDRTFTYFDASAGEDTFTVEYGAEGVEVFTGTWIEPDEIRLDAPKPDADRMAW